MKHIDRIGKIFDRTLDALAALTSIIILFMLCIVCFEVISRYFFNAPTTWVIEISSIILLFTPFLIGAWVLRKDGHVKMDLVLEMFGPKTRTTLGIITSFLAALSCLIVFYFGVKLAWNFHVTKYYTNTFLRLPKAPLVAIIPFGFFLLFLQLLRNMLSNIGKVLGLRAKPDDSKLQR